MASFFDFDYGPQGRMNTVDRKKWRSRQALMELLQLGLVGYAQIQGLRQQGRDAEAAKAEHDAEMAFAEKELEYQRTAAENQQTATMAHAGYEYEPQAMTRPRHETFLESDVPGGRPMTSRIRSAPQEPTRDLQEQMARGVWQRPEETIPTGPVGEGWWRDSATGTPYRSYPDKAPEQIPSGPVEEGWWRDPATGTPHRLYDDQTSPIELGGDIIRSGKSAYLPYKPEHGSMTSDAYRLGREQQILQELPPDIAQVITLAPDLGQLQKYVQNAAGMGVDERVLALLTEYLQIKFGAWETLE